MVLNFLSFDQKLFKFSVEGEEKFVQNWKWLFYWVDNWKVSSKSYPFTYRRSRYLVCFIKRNVCYQTNSPNLFGWFLIMLHVELWSIIFLLSYETRIFRPSDGPGMYLYFGFFDWTEEISNKKFWFVTDCMFEWAHMYQCTNGR